MTPAAAELMAALAVHAGMPPVLFWQTRLRDYLRILDYMRRERDEQRLQDVLARSRKKAGR